MATGGKLVITGEDRYLVKIQKMLRSYKKVKVEATSITDPIAEAKEFREEQEEAEKKEQEKTPSKGGAQDMTTANLTGPKAADSVPRGKTKTK
jgi:hypothetical protein